MNVVLVMKEILGVPNAMIGESALPDFSGPPDDRSERVRVAAFDQLDGVFERDVVCEREQKMNVFRRMTTKACSP